MPGPASDPATAARAAVEAVARDAYGRLLAILAADWRDIAAAEDALAEAFAAALRTWPEAGLPDRPEAWLLSAARRRLIDASRHRRVRRESAEALGLHATHLLETAPGHTAFPERRLELLFVCAHPAIPEDTRTPLMLQTVLGLDAARIASAFLVAPAAMGQRLVRAKGKIRDAGLPFRTPTPEELPGRLDAVLAAIYAAYGAGWDDPAGLHAATRDLAGEALWLGRMAVRLLPDEPEARGLLSLMLHCEARRRARRDHSGCFVPLSRQDVSRWDAALTAEAEALLAQAARAGRPGRFQLEAAIQSVHAARARTGATDWPAIVGLYGRLLVLTPVLGAHLAHAAAVAEHRGAEAGLELLDALPVERVRAHQPYWVLRAHLLDRLGRAAEAANARNCALGLTVDPSVRAFLAGGLGA